ncbi:MAG: hypothetical protein OER95_11205 [Acidimicrobiia bacterium]|nr:hypothetical protein [Acidimicrobiia bacterium]
MQLLLLLAEGFEAAQLPCTLVLLVTGVALGLTARETAIPAAVSFWLSVLVFSWTRFSDRGAGWHYLFAALALLIAVIILFVPPIRRLDWVAVMAGLLVGFAAAELWLPCVGPEFGNLLMELPDRGLSGMALMAIFLLGALSPVIALAALHHLLPNRLLEQLEPIWSIPGGVILAGMALATALGYHQTIIGWLFEWSGG